MESISILNMSISPWIYLPVVYITWVSFLFIFKKIVYVYVRQLAAKTKTQYDDIFLNAADVPLLILIVSSGGIVIEHFIPQAANAPLTSYFLLGFKAATIVAIVLFVDRLITGFVGLYSQKIEILKTSGGIFHGFLRMLVICLGLLVLLDSFGISITPVIASLGIGSLAVALAIQPTLENFFSGIQILMDKPIQIGQFIRLESGEEGYVYKIGWRSTWVQMPPNNVVVIPNKILVNAKVVNFYYPNPELALVIDIGVHYESDLDKVERVTLEVAREVMRDIRGGVKDFSPVVLFNGFGDFSIKCTVVLRVQEIAFTGALKHEFIKRLHKRYAKEGIVMPYPVQAINLTQEKAMTYLLNGKTETVRSS